jgi:hypothetical protein
MTIESVHSDARLQADGKLWQKLSGREAAWNRIRTAIGASLALIALLILVVCFTSGNQAGKEKRDPVLLENAGVRLIRAAAIRRLRQKLATVPQTEKLLEKPKDVQPRKISATRQTLGETGDGAGRGAGQRSHFGWGDTNADGVTVRTILLCWHARMQNILDVHS